MSRRRRARRVAALAAAAAAAAALPLAGDWRRFLPRSLGSGATLELVAVAEEDDLGRGPRRLGWSDEFLKEKLTLRTDGYTYHPRFLQYRLELGGALRQERYAAHPAATGRWTDADGLEYDAQLVLLPEHAANLELFAQRWEPLFQQRSTRRRSSVSENHGADLRFRRKPYFLHARYTETRLESDGAFASGIERLGLDGEYFRHFAGGGELSFSAALAPSRFRDATGLRGESDEARLANRFEAGRLALSSSYARNDFDQRSAGSGRFESEQATWYERLAVRLPAGLRADLAYRDARGESTFREPSLAAATRRTHRERSLELDLVHRLYDSLQTTLTHRRSERRSEGGESEALADLLGLVYTKRIPRGRLSAAASTGESEVESRGRTEVAEEAHPGVAVPGAFLLERTNADPASVVVFARAPDPPFEAVRLAPQLHYLVRALGDTVEVTVFALPPPFAVPGTFDLLVSYALLAGDFRLATRSLAHSASVELFDHLLTPYYSYSRIDSEVRSGSFPGGGLDATTTTAGVRLQRLPWRGRVEYRDVDWRPNPHELWRAEVDFTGALGPTTQAFASASWWQRRYPEGLPGGDSSATTERTRSLSASLQQHLRRRTLAISFGGSLSRSDGALATDATSVDSSLAWRVGRIDLSAGATWTDSETTGAGVPAVRRSHHLVYLRLRRELF